MGFSIDVNSFQVKMSTLLRDMIHVYRYTNDLVMNRNDTLKNHMDILDEILLYLTNSGIQAN